MAAATRNAVSVGRTGAAVDGGGVGRRVVGGAGGRVVVVGRGREVVVVLRVVVVATGVVVDGTVGAVVGEPVEVDSAAGRTAPRCAGSPPPATRPTITATTSPRTTTIAAIAHPAARSGRPSAAPPCRSPLRTSPSYGLHRRACLQRRTCTPLYAV